MPPPPPSSSTGSAPRRRSFWLSGGAVVAVVVCLGLVAAGGFILLLTGSDMAHFVAARAATATLPPTSTALPTTPPTVTPAQSPDATPLGPPGQVLFEDDFSDQGSGWDRTQDSDGGADYADGIYRIWVTTKQADYWATPDKNFADVRLQVTATKAAGPNDNDFGVICRLQDNDNFYAFLVSSDGFYGIMKMQAGERAMIGQDAMLSTKAIRQGDAANDLIAECIGDHLALHVNGQLVADVTDSSFGSGDVGLIAGTFDQTGVEIHFDDFVVHQP
jgi:hypothetical protein